MILMVQKKLLHRGEGYDELTGNTYSGRECWQYVMGWLNFKPQVNTSFLNCVVTTPRSHAEGQSLIEVDVVGTQKVLNLVFYKICVNIIIIIAPLFWVVPLIYHTLKRN